MAIGILIIVAYLPMAIVAINATGKKRSLFANYDDLILKSKSSTVVQKYVDYFCKLC